jgi:hypothetical protein
MNMRLFVLCEGQTEDRFVKEILYPYLQNLGIYAMSIICETKRTVSKKYKGGVSKYSKIKSDLEILCKGDPSAFVTTMFDYYKLPAETPGKGTIGDTSGMGIIGNTPDKGTTGNIYEKAQEIETAINTNLGEGRNLLVNLTLHEFEGLLFSDVTAFLGVAKADNKSVMELGRIKSGFLSPEHINDSEETAPSKRIRRILPEYSKTLNGIEIAKKIGIDKITQECPHFKAWIENIKAIAKGGAL